MNKPDQKAVDLVQRAIRGDQDAFADLFHQLNEPVLNYVYRMVGDRPTAEDITQDAFIRAHHRIDQLGPPWDFKSWVYRIAGNLAIDHLRKARRFVDVEEVELIGDSTTRRPPEKKTQMAEQRQAVWRTLDGMPTMYRQALVLREFNALSYIELSNALEVSYDAARQIVHRARIKFRDLHGIRMLAEEARQRCSVLDDMLSAYHDGELPESDLKRVKKHMKTCKDCQATEKEMQKVSAMLAVIPPIIPTALWKAEILGEITRRAADIKVKPSDQLSKPGVDSGSAATAQPGTGSSVASAFSKAANFLSTAWPMVVIPVVGIAAAAGIFLFANLPPGSPGGYGGGAEPSPSPTVASAVLPQDIQTPAPSMASEMAPSPSPSPTVTSTITATATLDPANATGLQNVKCRYGPDMVFDIETYLMKDETALIVGRNNNDTWWYIERNDGYGMCWVWDGVVEVRGDLSQVSFVASPSTPTLTPTQADTEAPQVDISLAPDGDGHPNNHDMITFTASAQDNRGVERIEIWKKSAGDATFSLAHMCTGVTECIYTGGPYESGILTYQARAYDGAGNEGLTLKKQVNVVLIIY
ncbi:MAG: sigma-70 family RNA polymerase sigma factor [Anaerolineales bacterium]|nr:sigma-70 family RNA polymerase sigma factor [Anaerolineales bacterium]